MWLIPSKYFSLSWSYSQLAFAPTGVARQLLSVRLVLAYKYSEN
jgi:hypothetical protein